MTLEAPPLADVVRAYRAAARLSQEELAERAAISVRTLSDIETGVSRWPRPLTVSLIAQALDLDPEQREALKLAASRRGLSGGRAAHAGPAGPPLIGRSTEMQAARRLLVDEHCRLVTLVGRAGVGKTALALAIGAELAQAYDDRLLVVDLVGIPDAKLVPTKVALTAGIRDVRGEPVAASFAAALGGRKMLLILDTFEHVIAAAPFVGQLLAAAPSLTVVATSRVALRVRDERTMKIGSLGLPAGGVEPSPTDLCDVASVRLLMQCVHRYDSAFAVTEDNARGVAALVRALDGVPFAIELAAPRLRKLTPAALAARLDRPLDVLTSERRGAPQRQRTMRGAIAWSYELLSAQQQQLFRRLGVFHGAFTEQAALHVAAPDGTEPLVALQTIAALVDQNLVSVGEDESGDARFEVHALVREFASELLEQHAEYAETQWRLARYCSELGERRPGAPRSRATLAALERESSNFDALLDWLVSTGDVTTGLNVAIRLQEYWWRRGAYEHGYGWFTALLELASKTPVETALVAEAHLKASGMMQSAGEIDRSIYHAERALPLKRALGDRTGIASLLSGLAACEAMRGDWATAHRHLTEALAIRRELGDALGTAAALADIGFVACEEGEYTQAGAYLEESVALNRAGGSDIGMSAALANLALLALRSGKPERAEAFAREALGVAERVGYFEGARAARPLLARALLERGDHGAAEAVATAMLEMERVTGADPPLADALMVLARVSQLRQDWNNAARLLGAASTVAGGVPTPAAERSSYESLVADVKGALGPRFDAEWDAGRSGAQGSLAALLRG